MAEKKLTDEQIKTNLEKMKTNTFGRTIRQILDEAIESLNKLDTVQPDPNTETMSNVVLGRMMAITHMRALRKAITENLAKKDNSDTIASEYE